MGKFLGLNFDKDMERRVKEGRGVRRGRGKRRRGKRVRELHLTRSLAPVLEARE